MGTGKIKKKEDNSGVILLVIGLALLGAGVVATYLGATKLVEAGKKKLRLKEDGAEGEEGKEED